jgi:type VI secretion system secreted protein VgrG
MDDSDNIQYECQIRLPSQTVSFAVLSLQGNETISKPFRFNLSVVSEHDIEIDNISTTSASITISVAGKERYVNGVLSRFSQVDMVKKADSSGQLEADKYIYEIEIVPRLWNLSLYHDTDFFMKKSIVDILKDVFKFAGISPDYYRLDINETKYPKLDFVVQWQENTFDFLSRLLEEVGIYYYFDHSVQHDTKVVFCDNIKTQPLLDNAIKFRVSGDDAIGVRMDDFKVEQIAVPNKIVMRGYSSKAPSQDIKVIKTVCEAGEGEQYHCGEFIDDQKQIQNVAQLRVDEQMSKRLLGLGKSNAIQFYAGIKFSLEGHFNDKRNIAYQITTIEHYGKAFVNGISAADAQQENGYYNLCTCLATTQQFRPVRLTPRPKISGSIIGEVVSNSVGQYADINENGEYKVQFRYDRTRTAQDLDYHWIRMQQSYGGTGGKKEGSQMMLRGGAEVVISFLNGEPRQPIITGVVANAKNTTVAQDPTINTVAATPGGGKIKMNDQAGEANTIISQSRNPAEETTAIVLGYNNVDDAPITGNGH